MYGSSFSLQELILAVKSSSCNEIIALVRPPSTLALYATATPNDFAQHYVGEDSLLAFVVSAVSKHFNRYIFTRLATHSNLSLDFP
ncbi:hypothetical protein MRB53_018553 [Persea americana]|uniref:Uncharacterized protein n=1 Tax=Persea americana TaxID=3435 RepID=A0ACC2M839_PERAE|nr:hypothetical protein MRB53_018553 [Persea americana]